MYPKRLLFPLCQLTGLFRDDGDNCFDDCIGLDQVISPNGQRICGYIAIDKENILDNEAFSGPCDSEDEREFTGNEHMPAEYRYHKTVSSLYLGNPGIDSAH